MSAIATQRVGPRDCALAFTFPLDEATFYHDLEPASRMDFVKNMARNREMPVSALWEDYLREIVPVAEGLLQKAEKFGVEVVRQASSTDLLRLFQARPIVILMAHWRGAFVQPQDIRDPEALYDRIAQTDAPWGRWLRSAPGLLPDEAGDASRGTSSEGLRTGLTERMNYFIANYQSETPQTAYRTAPMSQQRQEFQNRQILEDAFDGLLTHGNTMELRDGLFTPRQLAALLSPDFNGILDLTICNSILPGEEMRRWISGGHFIVNEQTVTVAYRLALYQSFLGLLAQRKHLYIKTLYAMREHLAPRRGCFPFRW